MQIKKVKINCQKNKQGHKDNVCELQPQYFLCQKGKRKYTVERQTCYKRTQGKCMLGYVYLTCFLRQHHLRKNITAKLERLSTNSPTQNPHPSCMCDITF